MRILVVGGGGREHALSWALAREAEVICAPGNPGIADDVEVAPVASQDTDGLVALAGQQGVDLVVVGPEDPLVNGLADRLRASQITTFGPGAAGAELEASKAFSKDFMAEAGVPTARFSSFQGSEAALAFVSELAAQGSGVVVKASGNALGKGAIVCEDEQHARETVVAMLDRRAFGDAGSTIVVEERLTGFEFSLLTLVSDSGILSLPVAQDYKRAFDGGLGPNTGGMGSCSPVAAVSAEMVSRTEAEVVLPILAALRARGIQYRGTLFSGLMVHQGRPHCIEYNVRFGDPETQSILNRLGDGFAAALLACAKGEPIPEIGVIDTCAVTVVVASAGYPDAPRKGFPISLPAEPKAKIFHAGTSLADGKLVNSGGRVFGVSGVGPTVAEARAQAYETARQIQFEGAWMRNDIASGN
jgi:phosphoribosylamine--glycine ligase